MKKKLAKKTTTKQSKKVTKNVPRGTTEKKAVIMNKKIDHTTWAIQLRKSGELSIATDSVLELCRMWYGLKPSSKRDARIVRCDGSEVMNTMDWHLRLIASAFVELLTPPLTDDSLPDFILDACKFIVLPRFDTVEVALRLTRKATK